VAHTSKTYDTYEAARQATYTPHRVQDEPADDAVEGVKVAEGPKSQSPPLHPTD
jgi:hypothetical protein